MTAAGAAFAGMAASAGGVSSEMIRRIDARISSMDGSAVPLAFAIDQLSARDFTPQDL